MAEFKRVEIKCSFLFSLALQLPQQLFQMFHILSPRAHDISNMYLKLNLLFPAFFVMQMNEVVIKTMDV